MSELRDVRPAPRIPVWLGFLVLVVALVVTAIAAGETLATVAVAAAVVSGWVVVAGTARRWTIGPWGAVVAAAVACGILLVQQPGYVALGVLFIAFGVIGMPVLLAIARVKRSADRLPDVPTRTDSVDGSSGLFD